MDDSPTDGFVATIRITASGVAHDADGRELDAAGNAVEKDEN